MGLQIARGREAKPPLRPVRKSPDTNPGAQPPASNVTPIAAPASGAGLRFPINPQTRAFYRRFYPGTSSTE